MRRRRVPGLASVRSSNVMQRLVQSNTVTIKYIEGSYSTKDAGNQLFEQGKLLFEAVNTQLATGQGLFKVEPNPTPPEPPKGGGSVLPWTFSVNGAYQSNFFTQSVTWSRELEYVGRTLRRMPCSIVLAVRCGSETEAFFFDVGDPNERCITGAKMKKMQERLKKEKSAQDALVAQAADDVQQQKLDKNVYTGIVNYLGTNSVTEDVKQSNGQSLGIAIGRQKGVTRYLRRSGDYRELVAELLV